MEKVDDSKDAVSSRALSHQAPPAEVFSSGAEPQGKASAQHKQDSASTKHALITKSSFMNEGSQREKTIEGTMVVSINDRKVKVGPDSDSTSLYTLCRRWLRNDAPRKEQPGVHSFAKLPKPLAAKQVSMDNISIEENESEDNFEDYLDGEIEPREEQELLESHIKHFRNVRKRLREHHKQRIERYKLRLALLLQPSPYQEKLDPPLNY